MRIADFVWTEELPPGFCSRVYATAELVLKVPFQGEEMESGYRAAWRLDDLAPHILDGDPKTGSLLMERLLPGTKLMGTPDEVALPLVSAMIRRLQGLDASGLMSLPDYFGGDSRAIELAKSAPATVFLHGDLHHENILRHGDGWKMIDPKGLAGDPNFEVVAFLRNPLGSSYAAERLDARLDLFAEALGLSRPRMLAWLKLDNDFDDGRDPELARATDALL